MMAAAITSSRRKLFRLLAVVIGATVLVSSCNRCSSPQQKSKVRIVSWGGKFQEDLLDNWWRAAANSCDNVQFEAGTWDGDYAALTSRIKKGINDWDLVHVEAHYVENPDANDLFESFPDRNLPTIYDQLRKPSAVPILEYGYVLAYRRDLIHRTETPTWATFFDMQAVPGKRGLRDFPLGNIEIALLSMGDNVEQNLYGDNLTRAQLEGEVDKAIHQLTNIKSSIIWWSSGDQLQRILTGGEVPLVAAWSGRVASAHRQLCQNASVEDCNIQVNDNSSLVSTDWWIIPKNAPNAKAANEFLKCMYTKDQALQGARKFQSLQGYSLPMKDSTSSDPVEKFFLALGSSGNPKNTHILEKFWSRNFEWINARWRNWRVQ